MASTRWRGFTLIEMLIAMVVLVLLMKVAAPSFTSFVDRRRVIGAANELSTDIQYARSLAVSKKNSVTLTSTSTTQYAIYDSAGNSYKTVTMPVNASITANATLTFSSLNGFLSNTANTVTFYITSSTSNTQAQIDTTYMGRVHMVCGTSSGTSSLC